MEPSPAGLIALAGLAAVAAAGTLRFRWLSPGGAIAAVAVGAAALAGAGPAGLGLLLAFFVSASVLTRLRRRAGPAGAGVPGPAPRGCPTPGAGAAPGDGDRAGRSARQVLANGGVAAGAALLGMAGALPGAGHAFAGALAAATADTWASEVGAAVGGTTRLVTDGRRVPPGSSGGVSAAGTAAGVAGALGVGGAAALLLAPGPSGAPSPLLTASAGGLAGMALDSLLGAALEGRYRFVDNDAINLAGTAAGALLAWSLAALTR